MQKNTEHIPNRDDVSTAILQHLDGLRGIDTHCHHLPDDQFQNMGVKFLYDHSYCLCRSLLATPYQHIGSETIPAGSTGDRWKQSYPLGL